MEARIEIDIGAQEALADALNDAGDREFALPEHVIRAIVGPAFLGQLDVNPLGTVPGSTVDGRTWTMRGKRVATSDQRQDRIRIEGTSSLQAHQGNGRQSDGRQWEHRVTLAWNGFIDLRDHRIVRLKLLAAGDERLRWGNTRLALSQEADVEHLMAGHPIDLDSGVRYGVMAQQDEK